MDTRCIRCDAARHWAPGLIDRDDEGLSYVARQPESAEEVSALWRAAVACPTQSIGTSEARRPPEPAFPYELTPGVYALGHNARSSFGAHSYLVPRPDGNLMPCAASAGPAGPTAPILPTTGSRTDRPDTA